MVSQQKTNNSLTKPHTLTFSDEGWERVKNVANGLDISLSKLLDTIGSGELAALEAEELEDLLDTIDGLKGLLSAKEEGTVPFEKVKAEFLEEVGIENS